MPIGETLAEARQRAGLTVAEVSEQTRIKKAVIEGIEGGDYSACGGDFYARANIRNIAGAVGADPGPLIAEYDALYRGRDALSAVSLTELLATSVPAARRAGPRVARGPAVPPDRPPGRWLIRAAVLGLVAVLGFGVYSRLSGPGHVMAAPPSAGKHAVTNQQPGPGRPGPAPTITRSAAAPAPGPTITHAAMTPAPAPAITRAGVAAASTAAAPAPTRTPASAGAPGPGGGSPPARDGIGGNPTAAPDHRLVHRHPLPKPAHIRGSAPGQAPPSHRHGRPDHHRRRAPAAQQAAGRSGHDLSGAKVPSARAR